MIIQLDTENKTVSLANAVRLGELFETLERLLPNGVWADYNIVPFQQNLIVEKIYIDRYPNPMVPNVPYNPEPWQPWITYGDNTNLDQSTLQNGIVTNANYEVTPGVFQVEVQG